jgi:hypothetical protein
MADSLKLKIKLLWASANLLTVKWKCTTTAENVFTIGNAFQEFVMTKQEFAREDKWENHALIMLNVIKHSHVDLVLSGLSKLCACQWLMSAPNVRQITIVNQEISVGRRMPLTQKIKKFVLRSIQLQIKLSSNGTKTLIQQRQLRQFSSTANTVSQVLQNRVILMKMWLFVLLLRILEELPRQVSREVVSLILTHATLMAVLFVSTTKIMNCNSNFSVNVVWLLKIEIKDIALSQTKT